MDHQPVKELVREWLWQRKAHPAPLPEIEQIRLELGWKAPQPDALSHMSQNLELSLA
jgi:hypothetical protein